MSIITIPYVFSVGNTIIASQHNSNFQTIYNDYNGNITNVNIATNAAITYSQLSLGNSIKPTDLLSTFNNSASQPGVVPSGGIILWSGASNAIPSGWFLCNGSNGTPNLEDQFIIGAGNTYAVGATGGSTTIVKANLPASALTISGSTANGSGNTCVQFTTNGGSLTTMNTTNLGSGTTYLPPYYALCWIMKS